MGPIKQARQWLLVGLLSLASVLSIWQWTKERETTRALQIDLEATKTALTLAEAQLLGLEEELASQDLSPDVRISVAQKQNFEAHGIQDPVQYLIDNLLQRPDLIDEPGVLGGVMAFSYPEFWILDDGWVLAFAGDGHKAGYILLQYQFIDGAVHWTRLNNLFGLTTGS